MNGEYQEQGPLGIPRSIIDNSSKYDTELPYLHDTNSFIDKFQKSVGRRKEAVLSNFADRLIRNPANIVPIFSNLDLISQLRRGVNSLSLQEALIQEAAKSIRGSRVGQAWKPKMIEQLFLMGLHDNQRISKTAKRLQGALFSTPTTIEESVDLHYNSAWVLVNTSYPEVREDLFSALCLENNVVSPLNAWCFAWGAFAPDDFHLGRYHTVDYVLDHVGMLLEQVAHPEAEVEVSMRSWGRIGNLGKLRSRTSSADQARVEAILGYPRRLNPQRCKTLSEIYAAEGFSARGVAHTTAIDYFNLAEESKRLHEAERMVSWPHSLKVNDPLRVGCDRIIGPLYYSANWEAFVVGVGQKMGYQPLTREGIEIDNLKLHILARNIASPEQRAELMREISESLLTGIPSNPRRRLLIPLDLAETFNDSLVYGGRYWYDEDKDIKISLFRRNERDEIGALASVLEGHRPVGVVENMGAIFEQTSELRNQLNLGYVRSLGKRGYDVKITDPVLRDLGYKSLLFTLDSDKTLVRMKLDSREYTFLLDANYRIHLGEDVKRFTNPYDQSWLELLTLSHLRSVLCTDEHQVREELYKPDKQESLYKKQTVYRGEHLRHLAPGREYSQDAFKRCLKSSLKDKNLEKINRDRKTTKETGQVTYVSAAEIPDGITLKPIRIAFANATEELRRVIPLGQLSEEELDRLEGEIFGELGIE